MPREEVAERRNALAKRSLSEEVVQQRKVARPSIHSHSFINPSLHSLVHWLMDSLMHWLFHWIIDSLLHWFTDSSIHWFIDSLIHWFIDWSIDSFVHWLVHSLSHCFTASLIHRSMNEFIRFINSFIQLRTDSFTSSTVVSQPPFPHSLMHLTTSSAASASQKLSEISAPTRAGKNYLVSNQMKVNCITLLYMGIHFNYVLKIESQLQNSSCYLYHDVYGRSCQLWMNTNNHIYKYEITHMHTLNKVASCLRAGWKASEWFRAILCCLGPACCSVRSMLSIASEFPQAALEPRKNKLLQKTQNNCRFKLQAFPKTTTLIVPVFKNHTWKKLQATSTTSTKRTTSTESTQSTKSTTSSSVNK